MLDIKLKKIGVELIVSLVMDSKKKSTRQKIKIMNLN